MLTRRVSLCISVIIFASFRVNATDSRCGAECTFESSLVDSATVKYFPRECSTVCSDSALYIGYETDLSEKQMTDLFQNMRHLVGDLIVTRSKYKTSRFLAPLETVDCANTGFFKWSLNDKMTEIGLPNLTNVSCRVEIVANRNMTQLNLPKMIPVVSIDANYSLLDVRIAYNSAEMCIRLEEMANLMTYDDVEFEQKAAGGIDADYCPPFADTSLRDKVCDVRNASLAEMPSDCVNVVGEVRVDGGSEEHVHKLSTLVSLFGRLVIENTDNLTNVDFLANLKHIVSLTDDEPALLVEHNPNLSNFTLPSLTRLHGQIFVPVVFNNNSEALSRNAAFCYKLRDSITARHTWIVKFDGKVCEDVEKASASATTTSDNSTTPSRFTFLLLLTTICILTAFL